MLFNSLHFALFFPFVVSLFFATRGRIRWWLLLVASAYFYMALVPVYILILVFLILVDFYAGLLIAGSQGHSRRGWLIASLAANLSVLFFFKYFGFASEQAARLAEALGAHWTAPVLGFVLPVGLSFHTFQSMSYTIEVYRGHQAAERNLTVYALYVLFFPQLVAGPIERPQNLLGQIRASVATTFDADRATSGLQLVLWGLLKKAVVADSLAAIVDRTYANAGTADSVALLLAAYAFSIQIYCDFSGYTDMARGTARVLGFELMPNFERPYEAISLGEFWRRWHLSLSTWFRDYLYFPLGGSRRGLGRTVRNTLVVFLVSGLWHGANWTFVIWGAIHGCLVALEVWWTRGRRVVGAARPPWRRGVQWFLTFHAVTLAWIFFRAPSLDSALAYLGRLFAGHGFGSLRGHNLGSTGEVVLAFGSAIVLLSLEALDARHGLVERLRRAPRMARWTAYYAAIALFISSAATAPQQFIYFQF